MKKKAKTIIQPFDEATFIIQHANRISFIFVVVRAIDSITI